MHVQMIDGLESIRTAVDHRAKPRIGDTFGVRNARHRFHNVAHKGAVSILHGGKTRNVSARDDQNVHGRLGLNIAERHGIRILIYDLGGNLAASDPAE